MDDFVIVFEMFINVVFDEIIGLFDIWFCYYELGWVYIVCVFWFDLEMGWIFGVVMDVIDWCCC